LQARAGGAPARHDGRQDAPPGARRTREVAQFETVRFVVVDRADAAWGPVATLAIGKSGAVNAALLAAAILANKYPASPAALDQYRAAQTAQVLEQPDRPHRRLATQLAGPSSARSDEPDHE